MKINKDEKNKLENMEACSFCLEIKKNKKSC